MTNKLTSTAIEWWTKLNQAYCQSPPKDYILLIRPQAKSLMDFLEEITGGDVLLCEKDDLEDAYFDINDCAKIT